MSWSLPTLAKIEYPGPRRRAPYRTRHCSGFMHAGSSWFGIGALNSASMSALGQKQTFAVHKPMSALHPKADVRT